MVCEEVDTNTVSTVNAFPAGYIDKDNESYCWITN